MAAGRSGPARRRDSCAQAGRTQHALARSALHSARETLCRLLLCRTAARCRHCSPYVALRACIDVACCAPAVLQILKAESETFESVFSYLDFTFGSDPHSAVCLLHLACCVLHVACFCCMIRVNLKSTFGSAQCRSVLTLPRRIHCHFSLR
jgi:hypothetical protein